MREQIGTRIALDVVLDAALLRRQVRGDLVHVARRDVALVGARMHRDARRAGVDARRGRRRARTESSPPRELRSVATLLTLTERRTDGIVRRSTACSFTASAISSAQRSDLRLVLPLEHDAQQRLGAGVAHQQPALAGEPLLDASHTRRRSPAPSAIGLLAARARSPAPADRSSRSEARSAERRGRCPPSSAARSAPSPGRRR